MAQDWAADVKKYVLNADDEVIKGIVRYCGIALQKPDSSMVSFTDPVELGRVRTNFLKKKLALTHPDSELDAAIAVVGERMKGDRTKNRVTVYYLLLDHLGLHHMFKKGGVAPLAAVPVAAAAVVAPVAASADAALPDVVAPVAATPVKASAVPVGIAGGLAAAGAGAAMASHASATSTTTPREHGDIGGPLVRHVLGHDGKGGLGWLLWALVGLIGLWAIWMLMTRPAAPPVSVAVPDATVAAPVEPAAAAVPQAAPQGAGIIAEERDAKPIVKVYFDTGKADVVPAFAAEAATMKAYLDAHAGSALGVSGYNDPRGNAAVNAALSKKRAQAVQAALVSAGVPAASIELIKPEAATDATTSLDEARRVEVYIK
jgi:outer membrane protein OmpA-like peptidoglycan-associated protein